MADKYAILQLQETDETARERFMSLRWLHEQGLEPNPEHYDLIYTADLTRESLEELFILFNTNDMPKGFTGHAMSVSDIVVLIGEHLNYYYCDSYGFEQIFNFHHSDAEDLRAEP